MKSVLSIGEMSTKKQVSFGSSKNDSFGEIGVNNHISTISTNTAADRDSSSSDNAAKSKIWKSKKKKFTFAHHKARSGDWGGLLTSRRRSDESEDKLSELSRTNHKHPDVNKVGGRNKIRSFSLLPQKPTSRGMAAQLARSINHSTGHDAQSPEDRLRLSDQSDMFGGRGYSDGSMRRFSKESSGAASDECAPLVGTSRKSVLRRENIDATAMSMGLDDLSANFLDFISEAKCRDWLKSLSRCDPRHNIKAFFDDVAKDGADNIEKENGFQPELLSPLLSMFQRSSVFSVWRPTSVDSIRKMMTGQGTGKGLDIKGKSAKKGKLSAYVPFLQIHDDAHKTKIRVLPRDERIRVFYKKREARNHAQHILSGILNDMVKQVGNAERSLKFVQQAPEKKSRNRRATTAVETERPSVAKLISRKKRLTGDSSVSRLSTHEEDTDNDERPELQDKRNNSDLFGSNSITLGYNPVDRSQWKVLEEWAMDDPYIEVIDDYAPVCFGMDIPKRLFWEGYVMRAKDISREPGTEYDTGRPSRASFQDMNFASIKKEPEEDSPRAVVWQYTDPYLPPNEPDPDPMMPQTLLMAYEEHGSVKPVVSDFDCFLLGTRGVRFHNPLPDEQVKLVHNMIDDIEKILKDCSEGKSTNWTTGWLNQMKRHTSHMKMPKYGFGDPKSYAIMKYAVHRLEEFGAVRHGAECFNYYFPQELDDEFLVIGGNLEGAKYKYMTLPELQTFLSDTIDKGFTFPLNPKWVLCDDGWAALWDKLVNSTHPNVQLSISAWYPPESGVRKRIEDVHQKYPKGYQSDLSGRKKGTQAWDEAEIALDKYQRIQRAKRKLYCVLCFISILQQTQKKIKARQISEESPNSGESFTGETKTEKFLATIKDNEGAHDEIEVVPSEEVPSEAKEKKGQRVSFSERRSSSSSTELPLEPPSREEIANMMPAISQGLLRSRSASGRASGRSSSLFRRTSSSSVLLADDSIAEENCNVEVIDSLLDDNDSLSESQKLGLRNIRELLLSKEQGQQHRPRMERRHTTIDARLTALMLEDVPSFIIREYGGDNALNDPVQKLQTQVKSIMNAQGFIASAGGRNSLKEGPYIGNGSFLPVEWTRLKLDVRKGLAKKLSFKSLSAWEFNIIDFSKECKGTPLLFIGWAVLGSPYAQKAMASDLGHDPETEVDGYNFVTDFNMKMPILCSFLRAMENDYMPNPYHNSTHAADVVQTLNVMLQLGGKDFAQSSLQIFSILIAAVIHDVRHPGLNNNYQVNTRSELALQYNDVSVLEHMSAAWFFNKVLGPSRDFTVDIFTGLSKGEFDKVRSIIIKSVLETDMTHHFALLKKIGFHQDMLKGKAVDAWRAPYTHEGTTYDPSMDMLCFLLHQADISNPAKPYPLFIEWADGILKESYAQGDKEASLSLPLSPLCDRATTKKKQSQIGFIKFVVQPSIQLLGEIMPRFRKVVFPYIDKSLEYWEDVPSDDEEA